MEKLLAESLNSMLEGIAGHISEHGDCDRYWHPDDVDKAVENLRLIAPDSGALRWF